MTENAFGQEIEEEGDTKESGDRLEGLDAHLFSDAFDVRQIHRRLFVGVVFVERKKRDGENEEEGEEGEEGIYHGRKETGVEEFEEGEDDEGASGIERDSFVAEEERVSGGRGRGRGERERGHRGRFCFLYSKRSARRRENVSKSFLEKV